MEDTQGSIYILANDGDWKQHCRDLPDCRSYRGINSLSTTSLFSRAVFCKKWPLAEATNLLLLIPDNGLYTKWTPTINTWDPLKNLCLLEKKYYLADGGYSKSIGLLTTYQGHHYHMFKFNAPWACTARIPKELFNHRHSSLQNAIERTSGMLK
ncbi:hypothetical protein EJ110_NYTH47641 [Nymphaea thermarum]|nr:hypothetical protein EJ110_NYTH47641 [Nymphaea thermarum]